MSDKPRKVIPLYGHTGLILDKAKDMKSDVISTKKSKYWFFVGWMALGMANVSLASISPFETLWTVPVWIGLSCLSGLKMWKIASDMETLIKLETELEMLIEQH